MCELYHPFSVCLAKASLNAQGLFLNQIDKRLKDPVWVCWTFSFPPKMLYYGKMWKHKWVKKLNQISSKQIHLFLSRWMLLLFFFFKFFQKAKVVTGLRCVRGGGRRNYWWDPSSENKASSCSGGGLRLGTSTRWRFISCISPRIWRTYLFSIVDGLKRKVNTDHLP